MSVPSSGWMSTLKSKMPGSPVLSSTGIGDVVALAGSPGLSGAGMDNWMESRSANWRRGGFAVADGANLRPRLADSQLVHAHLSHLAVLYQFESLGNKPSQHQ